jgi:hypothetical protein
LVAFFDIISGPLLVRGGKDVKLPKNQHTRLNVYSEMLRQIINDYPSLGDWRLLEEHEIEFFYDGLRPAIKKATKPR